MSRFVNGSGVLGRTQEIEIMTSEVTFNNGWSILVFVAAVAVIVSFVTQGNRDPFLYYYVLYFLILGVIGGWIWLPIVMYRAWKRGEV